MVNFGPLLAAEIDWRVWGSPSYLNEYRVLAALLHGRQVVGITQTASLNALFIMRHLRSAGRPSRWALTHILVLLGLIGGLEIGFVFVFVFVFVLVRSR